MSQSELLISVLEFFEKHSVDYMLTGSVVSSLQGEPRATHDIDVVVDLTSDASAHLLAYFTFPDFYISEDAIADAIQRRTMFNLLHSGSGNKIDFWMITADSFDQERFKRRIRQSLPGINMVLSTPEDTILKKLSWAAAAGESQKQFTDAKRVFELQYSLLDISYIEKWVPYLAIQSLWDRLKTEANPL